MTLAKLPAVTAAFAVALVPIAALAASASTTLKGAEGVSGSATFTDGPQGVLIQVEVRGVSPGWHAMHFHEKGDCSDPKFQSAGAHINHAATKKPHGLLNPQGPDMGDLPNIHVGEDGVGRAQAFSTLVSVGGAGQRPSLTDADGSALVIHANPDDHKSQPIGGAGDRIACGVVKPAG